MYFLIILMCFKVCCWYCWNGFLKITACIHLNFSFEIIKCSYLYSYIHTHTSFSHSHQHFFPADFHNLYTVNGTICHIHMQTSQKNSLSISTAHPTHPFLSKLASLTGTRTPFARALSMSSVVVKHFMPVSEL